MTRDWRLAFGLSVLLLGPTPGWAAFDDEHERRYTILSQDLADVLGEFSAGMDMSLNVDPEVEGRVTNFRHRLTDRGFLDRLAADQGIVWYYDGDTLHVTPARDNRSIFVDFRAVTPEMLRRTLDTLAVSDDRFDVRMTGPEGIGVVTGPPRYIELVEHAFTLLQGQTGQGEGTAAAKRSVLVVRGGAVQIWRGRNDLAQPNPAETEAAEVAPDDPETPAPEGWRPSKEQVGSKVQVDP
ncbi:MAG: hypothetical protein AAF264_05435 [Pseudomonadota bacterium]